MTFHRPFILLLLGLATATAQDAAEAPPGVPIPGATPPPAAGAPAAVAPANRKAPAAPAAPVVPLGQTKIIADINEQKLSGSALAGLYRKYTGRRVIVSSTAATAEFTFVQEATPEDSLTFAEAAELLKKAATIEGFVFVPDEQDKNLDILTAAAGIRPTQRGVDVYNENSTLPEGDAVISYVMTLSFIKPEQAVNTFTQIIGQFGAYGSIAAVPNASAVVITENTSLIRKLIDLKKEIDKPGSVQGTRFIPVKYADVTEVAETLTSLLTAQQSTQKTAGIQRTEAAPAAGLPVNPGTPGGASSGEDSPVQIIPDPRTNRIFAMGRPVDLVFVEGLVREFDVETSEKNFLRRKLRFLKVSEFLPIAGDAITRATSGTGTSSGGSSSPPGTAGAPQSNGNNNLTSSNNRGGSTSSRNSASRSGSSSSSGGLSGGGAGGGGAGGGEGLSAPNVSSAPERLLVGRTFLVADNITNSIVVQGPPSSLEIIGRLLDQIDVKPDQVMISTVIGQLTLNDNFNVGLDYLKLGNSFVGRGGDGSGGNGGLPILNQLIPAIAGTPAVDGPGGPGSTGSVPAKPGTPAQNIFNPGQLKGGGLQVYGKIGNNLNVYLSALQSKTDFTVLSRPSIFTANNQKGTISSGERIAIPTSSNSFGSSGNSSTNIEYQDVVLKLEVIPLVNSDNEITMQIALLSDEQNGTQTIAGAGSNGANLTVPRISTREILTTVTVPNNETIVLGGLIISKNDKTKSGIPILSSIPYIGSLFGSTTKNKDRTELMVFMQPSIVANDRSLNDVQADMDSRYKVSQRARDFAEHGDVPPLPANLPPAPLPPLSDKESAHTHYAPAPRSTTVAPTKSSSKLSIRPAYRN